MSFFGTTSQVRITACFAATLAMCLSLPAAPMLSSTAYSSDNSAGSQPEFLPVALATSTPLSHADRHFLEKALQVVRDEMQLSHLAMDRATDERVRGFAHRIYSAQSQAEKTLAVMIASKGLSPRNSLRSDRYFSALNEKEGEAFDLYFVGHLIDIEDDMLTLFVKSSQSDDADIAAFASRTLASLEAHMREAKEIEQALRQEQ